ncbi:LemA family protein [Morganella morganii]|uniref:LemA family protein n=1 Tax=Morganella morganii TaxID=582 RepID=UPI0023676BE1|nr:LemA family protein [Morganella morganii]
MGTIVFIALVIAVAGIVWVRRVYLRINDLQAPLTEAYAAIDGMLHQRAEKIGQLVDMTEKAGIQDATLFYFRQDAYPRYTAAATLDESVSAANDISSVFYHIMTLTETFPALIADPQFVRIQLAVCDIDDALRPGADAFNNIVIDHNVSVHHYPDVLVAHLFGYKPRVLLEI